MKKFFFIIIIAAVIISAFFAYGSKHDLSKQAPVKKEDVNNRPITNLGQKSFAEDSNNDSSSVANPTPYGKPDKDEEPRDKPKNVSLKELAGPVHNNYGIRDDIYKYIQEVIPPDNQKAMKAATAYAASSQFINYGATEEEAIKANQKMFIAINCLTIATSHETAMSIGRNVNTFMSNTHERDAHLRGIAKKYFSWKILGSGGLTPYDIKEICKTEDY